MPISWTGSAFDFPPLKPGTDFLATVVLALGAALALVAFLIVIDLAFGFEMTFFNALSLTEYLGYPDFAFSAQSHIDMVLGFPTAYDIFHDHSVTDNYAYSDPSHNYGYYYEYDKDWSPYGYGLYKFDEYWSSKGSINGRTMFKDYGSICIRTFSILHSWYCINKAGLIK